MMNMTMNLKISFTVLPSDICRGPKLSFAGKMQAILEKLKTLKMWGKYILKLKNHIKISYDLKNQITKVGSVEVQLYVKTEVTQPYCNPLASCGYSIAI